MSIPTFFVGKRTDLASLARQEQVFLWAVRVWAQSRKTTHSACAARSVGLPASSRSVSARQASSRPSSRVGLEAMRQGAAFPTTHLAAYGETLSRAHILGVKTCLNELMTALLWSFPEPLQFHAADCDCPIGFHEDMMVRMFRAVQAGKRGDFDRQCEDILGAALRARIWSLMEDVSVAICAAQLSSTPPQTTEAKPAAPQATPRATYQ